EGARAVQQVGYGLDGGRLRIALHRVDDRLRHVHAGKAPRADQTLDDQALERRNDLVDVRIPTSVTLHLGLGGAALPWCLLPNVPMQKEQVHAVEPHVREALLERSAELGVRRA